MDELIFFSNNQNKIKEISIALAASQIKILNLNNFKKIKSPKENGQSFEENAKIKSLFGFKIFKKPCFADDSGICIEAMDWGPGINSKKYLNQNRGLEAFNKIFNLTKIKKNYKAFFKTSICMFLNEENYFIVNGIIKGKISKKPRGEGGFGYDPIFVPNGKNKTFAEMSVNEKNLISHRSIAIKKLQQKIKSLI